MKILSHLGVAYAGKSGKEGCNMKSNASIKFLVLALAALGTSSAFAATPQMGEISMEKAKGIATKKIAGDIKSSEYEFEKGQNVYSFDINGKDGKVHEILVSAKTGKIVSSTIESASKEAAEAAADQKTH
jgi:uncharacterized membrane protein YkoI